MKSKIFLSLSLIGLLSLNACCDNQPRLIDQKMLDQASLQRETTNYSDPVNQKLLLEEIDAGRTITKAPR